MTAIRRVFPLLLGLLVLGVAPVGAQTITSPYRFLDYRHSAGVLGGYIATDAGRLDLGPESSPVVGARYTFRLGGALSLEAQATLIPTTREVFDTVAINEPLQRVGEADLTILSTMAALRFNVTGPRTWYGFQPYLLGGLGFAFELSGTAPAEVRILPDARFDFGTRFAGQVGAGVEWFAARRLSIFADARDVFWKLKFPAGIRRQDEGKLPADEWVQNFQFQLGAAYHF